MTRVPVDKAKVLSPEAQAALNEERGLQASKKNIPSSGLTTAVPPKTGLKVVLDPSPERAAASSAAALRSNGISAKPPVPKKTLATDAKKETSLPERKNTDISSQAVDALHTAIEDGGYIANPFGKFDNVAYHWRMFMTGQEDVTKTLASGDGADISPETVFNALDNTPNVIIAESGVTTGFNIQSVRMDQIVGPNFQSRNTNTTGFSIDIVEPLGTSLLEKIRNAASELRIDNFNKVFYYLELTFRGYTVSGDPVNPAEFMNTEDTSTALPNGGRWIYQVMIKDIASALDSSGSNYTITAIPYNESALEEDYVRTPTMHTVPATTVGEFLDGLAAAMSKNYLETYGTEYATYKFVTHPIRHSMFENEDPRNWKIGPEEEEFNSSRALFFTDNKSTVTIAQGTSLTDVVEYLFANTPKAQQIAKDVACLNERDVGGDKSTVRRFRESILFRLEPDVTITKYDPVNKTYQKDITFHIWAFATQAPTLSARQSTDAEDPRVQVQMMNELHRKGFFRKRYDHYFTGKNTEVTKLDVKYNMAWTAVLPRVLGNRMTTESVSQHAKYNNDIVESGNLQSEIINYNAELGKLRMINAEGKLRLQQIDTSKSDLANREETKNLIVSNESKILALEAAKNDAVAQQAARRRDIEAAQQDRSPTDLDGRSYVEDFRETPSGDDLPLIITFKQADVSRNVGTGNTPSYGRDRGLYGAILEQLYGPVTQALINVDMEIRGDPYWIGYSNMERKLHMREGPPPFSDDTQFPNYIEGDCTFLLHFDYPFDIDPETGDPVIRENSSGRRIDTFNGIYRVVRVEHRFTGGVFSQTLHANRLSLIDIARVLGFKGAITTSESSESNIQSGGGLSASDSTRTAPSGSRGTNAPNLNTPASVRTEADKRVKTLMSNPTTKATADRIIERFENAGYTRPQAIGALANAIGESSLNPKAVGDDGASYGLFQTNIYGAGKGQSRANMLTADGNTTIILNETARDGKKFKTATTPEDAAYHFTTEIERPAAADKDGKTRAAIAKSLASYYGGS